MSTFLGRDPVVAQDMIRNPQQKKESSREPELVELVVGTRITHPTGTQCSEIRGEMGILGLHIKGKFLNEGKLRWVTYNDMLPI